MSDSGKLAERIATALVFISFSYSGFNAATYLGGEIRKPRRNIPLALMVGTGLVMLLYVLVNMAYLAAVPSSQLSGVKEVGAIAAQALLGQRAGGLFNVLVAVCLLSSLGAMLLTGPRVYCAMAGDGLFPGTLGRVRSRSGVPSNAVRLQAGIAALMIVTASFETLLFYIGFTLSLFAALSVSGLMVLRHRLGPPASFRTPFYPWAPLLFIAANAWIIVFSLAGNPWRALARCHYAGGGRGPLQNTDPPEKREKIWPRHLKTPLLKEDRDFLYGTLLYTTPSCEPFTGYGPEEFISELRKKIVHPDDPETVREHSDTEFTEFQTQGMDYPIVTPKRGDAPDQPPSSRFRAYNRRHGNPVPTGLL